MALNLEQYRLDSLPSIFGQLMKPVEKIDSIRINQVSGFGSSVGTPGASGDGESGDASGGGKPPVNQVLDSILGMAIQLPALRNIGDSIGYDFSQAMNSVRPSDGKPQIEQTPKPDKDQPDNG